jgi:hypothetical protein
MSIPGHFCLGHFVHIILLYNVQKSPCIIDNEDIREHYLRPLKKSDGFYLMLSIVFYLSPYVKDWR